MFMINREPILHELENVTLERIQKEFNNELKNNKCKHNEISIPSKNLHKILISVYS